MHDTIRRALDALRRDGISGASELLPQAIRILRQAAGEGDGMGPVARAVGLAQPSMACLWNAALAALAGQPTLDRFEQRSQGAVAAMTRAATVALAPAAGRRLHVITCSFSGSVLACVRAIAASGAVRVSCAEGRPGYEGRRMAEALAGRGCAVTLYTDAAIAEALQGHDEEERVVVVGADAVTPEWIINKVGTGMLAAAAVHAGVPVHVAATREKFVDSRVGRLLAISPHAGAEVWDGAPEGVAVRNPYFERVAIDLVAGFLTDAGLLTGDMVAEACRAASAGVSDADLARLVGSGSRDSGFGRPVDS
jgi:translation initiation factor 2B subunit (eIF-2B alpha/beta/delta family)